MGGLKEYMPTTYKTFMVATLAISGIPLFSGFFSKDEILWNTFNYGGWFAWLVLAIAAFFTAFYMFRLVNLVFLGKERFDKKHIHPHEAPKTMTIPLVVLAFLSAFGGFLGVPYVLGFWFSDHPNLMENWLHPVFRDAHMILQRPGGHEIHAVEYLLMIVSVAIALLAIKLAYNIYQGGELDKARALANRFKFAYKTFRNKYWVDEFYFATVINPLVNTSRKFLWRVFDVRLIDGLVNGLAAVTDGIGRIIRRIQSGVAQNYAVLMMAGIIIIISVLVFSV
jgi:NADH-quinone oxidoreductase subunit L